MPESEIKSTKVKKDKTTPIIRFSFEKIAFAFIWSGLVIIILAILSFAFRDLNFLGINTGSFELLGQFGEYIGGLVGSIWALAGVILFYETLRFQRTELRLQREELQNQRSEIMEQTRQYIIQNQTLMTRKMEGTFFQLISLHNEIVDSLIINFETHPTLREGGNSQVSGRYCFNLFYKNFVKHFNENVDLTGMTVSKQEDALFLISKSFKAFYIEFQEDIVITLEIFLTSLYMLIKVKCPTKNFIIIYFVLCCLITNLFYCFTIVFPNMAIR